MTEKRFRNALLKRLPKPSDALRSDKEVPVPYSIVCTKKRKECTVRIWCFAQDIVYYKPLFYPDFREAAVSVQRGSSLVHLKIERGNAGRKKEVGIPFLIIETKKSQPTTHEIIAYSEKARLIKTIFPYCKYVLCIRGSVAPRSYHHGADFDEVLGVCLSNKSDIATLKRSIGRLLGQARKEMARIS
jgi:hypothetical protein